MSENIGANPPPGATDTSARRDTTSTQSFGSGRREGHDASAFYERFTPPVISDDETVVPAIKRDEILHGMAQKLLADETHVADNSVALMVTSPPYFVGKDYEEAMGEGHVPKEYGEHLDMLQEVFARCVDKLEPGGRIAVNVANLGRRPYRSQAADVLRIFEDLGLLLRGEVIWQKGKGLNGSTAWGSFQSAANPVLRDVTERVIVASKGRFDRAIPRRKRAELGLPSDGSISKEAFMSYTTDVWEMNAESATRIGHPAPFPVSLPQRLIELYTYYGDLVLDPYMGAASTAIAALRTDRHFIGCETEEQYIEVAKDRIDNERARLKATAERREKFRVTIPAIREEPLDEDDDLAERQAQAVRQGRKAEDLAEIVLAGCGFKVERKNLKLPTGVEVDFVARAYDGSCWYFDVTGAFTSERGGLRRTDTLWKSLGKAAMRQCDASECGPRFILLTTDVPRQGVGLKALKSARKSGIILDAIEMLSDEGQQRLNQYAEAGESVVEPIGDLIVPNEQDALF